MGGVVKGAEGGGVVVRGEGVVVVEVVVMEEVVMEEVGAEGVVVVEVVVVEEVLMEEVEVVMEEAEVGGIMASMSLCVRPWSGDKAGGSVVAPPHQSQRRSPAAKQLPYPLLVNA